jgi:7-carboxy-7-deazaguanine synthase
MLPGESVERPIYALQERFLSFQGEGVWAGQCAYFLRLYGCDQRCHWCDSAGTWHPDWRPDNIQRYDAEALSRLIPIDEPFAFTVITGGEPTMYNLVPLIHAIRERTERPVHIETAGHRPIPPVPAWLTLSPKPFAKPPLPDNVFRANEFKIIVEGETSIGTAMRTLIDRSPSAPIWLHPEWSKRNDPVVLEAITRWVTANGSPFRAGYQVHKLFRADTFDDNADKRLIPLGGVITNGY